MRVLQLSLVTKQSCLSLIQRNLEGPGIDHRQQVAFVNVLTFFEINLRELTVYATLHADGIGGRHAAQAFEIDGHVAALSGCNAYRDCGLSGGSRGTWLGAGVSAGQQECADQEDGEGREDSLAYRILYWFTHYCGTPRGQTIPKDLKRAPCLT